MTNTVPSEQKQTAREYLRRAFSTRAGHWFTMEEIKAAVLTSHGIHALGTRANEAVKDGELISRFRDGTNYKEWTWLVRKADECFFYKLQGQDSPLYTDFSALTAQVKKLLYKPQDEISVYRGTPAQPVFLERIRLSPQDLVARSYRICSECHGTGSADVTRQTEAPCIFCSGTGWIKVEA